MTPDREKGSCTLSIQSDNVSIYINIMSVIVREKNCDVLLLPCFYLYYIEFISDTFPFVAAPCYRGRPCAFSLFVPPQCRGGEDWDVHCH